MCFKGLNYHVKNEIVHIQLNTEDRRNTLNSDLLREIDSAITLARQEKEARILILSGEGNTFSVGADITEMDALQPQEVEDFVLRGQAVIQALMHLELPTIAAVNGLAFGGGFELALACDIIWAHKRALFSFPECKLGLIPAWGGLQLIPHRLPASAKMELLLSGDRMNAQAAYDMGLISRIFEGREFLDNVIGEAQKFLSRDASVLRALKRLCRREDAFEDGLSEASSTFQTLWIARNETMQQTVKG